MKCATMRRNKKKKKIKSSVMKPREPKSLWLFFVFIFFFFFFCWNYNVSWSCFFFLSSFFVSSIKKKKKKKRKLKKNFIWTTLWWVFLCLCRTHYSTDPLCCITMHLILKNSHLTYYRLFFSIRSRYQHESLKLFGIEKKIPLFKLNCKLLFILQKKKRKN